MSYILAVILRLIAIVVFGTLLVRSGYRIGYRDCAAGRTSRIDLLDRE